MKRSYPSGSSKRKLKYKKIADVKKIEGTLLKYVESRNDESETSNTDTTSTTIETVHNAASAGQNDTSNIELSFDLRDNRNVCASNSGNFISVVESLTITSSEKNENFYNDPYLWQNITDSMREYFLLHPPEQNMECIKKTERSIGDKKRFFTINHLYRTKCNQEKVKREWLVLSPSTGAIFCWICRLFSKTVTALSSNTGFCDWSHTTVRLREHENSHSHREAVCQMMGRKQTSSRIDSKVAELYNSESKYWFQVLRRVVAVTKFLSSRGMPFFGQNETIGSVHNGNFLGCLELISEFDPFLAKHLETRGNPGSGHTSYLSSTIIDEFINLMGSKVSNTIISEVKSSKYFSIILDSTPDISHTDQLTFVIRYVSEDNEPVERFLQFIPIHSHSSQHLEETVTTYIQSIGLNILDCRGQSYDNASNMAGKYSGLQARLKALNPHAEFVPCSAHSLNLVIVKSMESNGKVLDFFTFLQELYNFFSNSTHRWMLLNDKLKENKKESLTLKSRSETRWCANAAATKALRQNYKHITEILLEIAEKINESAVSRSEANALHKKLQKLETAIFAVTWDVILQRADCVSKMLQNPSLNLSQVPEHFSSLINFTNFMRENFEIYEKEACLLVGHAEYCMKRPKKLPKYFHDGNSENVTFSNRDSFKISCFNVMCDTMIVQLKHRMSAYVDVLSKFSCLFDKDKESAYQNAKVLQKVYTSDLEESFMDEFIHVFSFIQNEFSITEKLKKINNFGINGTFANVETALKLFLTLPISNCTGERSFSLLKRLKSPLRTLISQSKLSSLALLAIESDITQRLDFNDVIDEFVKNKNRRKIIKH